ncbi:MAG: glycosyl transferase [Sphingobacteriales bacterium]|nr:MAG: glycosyl transferase [Sphingobacteriales bacterium]
MKPEQKILIAPLDWGLGHTTRCIPIIHYLRSCGHKVYAGAEGNAAKLLQSNFPDLELLDLKGYNIEYSKKKSGFTFKILQQLPKILSTLKAEHRWLEKMHRQYQFDAVISDNRYGFYHKDLKNVILTHQVQPLSGMGKLADQILLNWHRGLLERFQQCWIVDTEKAPGLSGKLGHPQKLPANARYIGYLSQFFDTPGQSRTPKPNHFLILLSGPEPMRSQFEAQLWQQCSALNQYTFTFVAGKPGMTAPEQIPAHIKWYPYMSAAGLAEEILDACGMVCRGGYTTIMDLQILQRPALLVPTPGQTEQEYLAQTLSKVNPAFSYDDQQHFELEKELAKMLYLPPLPQPAPVPPLFREIVAKWLNC